MPTNPPPMLRLRRAALLTLVVLLAANAQAAPKFAEGMYRVDWNGKVRDLCVDFYTNDDLTARDWQGVLAAQGAICQISDVRTSKLTASWTGRCSQPWMGRVANVAHQVSVKSNPDGSFDILTVLSGDQQARIPIRGVPVNGRATKCAPDSPPFRPWQ